MHKINGEKAEMLTDTVQGSGTLPETVGVVPGEGAGWRYSHRSGCALSVEGLAGE